MAGKISPASRGSGVEGRRGRLGARALGGGAEISPNSSTAARASAAFFSLASFRFYYGSELLKEARVRFLTRHFLHDR